jgi:hypothetical protein
MCCDMECAVELINGLTMKYWLYIKISVWCDTCIAVRGGLSCRFTSACFLVVFLAFYFLSSFMFSLVVLVSSIVLAVKWCGC